MAAVFPYQFIKRQMVHGPHALVQCYIFFLLFFEIYIYIYILRCFFPIASNTSTSEAADVLPKVAQVLGEARHGLALGICSFPKLVIFLDFARGFDPIFIGFNRRS